MSLSYCTGEQAALREYVRRGYYLGMTGFISMRKRGEDLRSVHSLPFGPSVCCIYCLITIVTSMCCSSLRLSHWIA
jgi:hypothetical protein